MAKVPQISVVDDDDSMRESLRGLLRSSGLELQRRLVSSYPQMPVIFITAHGDEELRSRALKGGAVDYLLKPFSEEALLNAIQKALSPE